MYHATKLQLLILNVTILQFPHFLQMNAIIAEPTKSASSALVLFWKFYSQKFPASYSPEVQTPYPQNSTFESERITK
jgi:hypothetical protein